MSINDEVFQFFKQKSKEYIITDLLIGIKFIYVELNNRIAGISNLTINNPVDFHFESRIIIDQSAYNVLNLILSKNQLEQSIAWSIVNALSRIDFKFSATTRGNIVDIINFNKRDNVFMFGHFKPIEERVRKKVKKLYISDIKLEEDDNIVNSDEIPNIAPKCNKIILTATSLMNQTFESVISLFNEQKPPEIFLLGPSTPFFIKILKKYKIKALSGVKIIDKDRLKKIIAQGGGTQDFGDSVRKVNFILP